VTEELGIKEGGVETSAVHFDEGGLGSGAQVVDHARHPPFSGAAFAVQEHGGALALGQQAYLVGEVLHARR
jgi:hypothetical protein